MPMTKFNSTLQEQRRQSLRIFVQLTAVALNFWVLANTIRAGLWMFSMVAIVETLLMIVTTLTKPKAVTTDWWGWVAALFIMVFPLTATDVLQVHTTISLVSIFIGDFLMFLAIVLELLSLAYLNTAFTQAPEARKVVARGPYRYLRHPLYTAYVIVYFGQAIQWNEFLYWVTFVAFLIVLVIRAKAEENILLKTFPAYGAYRKKTKWFGL